MTVNERMPSADQITLSAVSTIQYCKSIFEALRFSTGHPFFDGGTSAQAQSGISACDAFLDSIPVEAYMDDLEDLPTICTDQYQENMLLQMLRTVMTDDQVDDEDHENVLSESEVKKQSMPRLPPDVLSVLYQTIYHTSNDPAKIYQALHSCSVVSTDGDTSSSKTLYPCSSFFLTTPRSTASTCVV